MCGIVGLFSKTNVGFFADDAVLFSNMLLMDMIRGTDSTGVFGVTNSGQFDILKGDTNSFIFQQSESYINFKRRIARNYVAVVGHNRAATRGTVTPQNAHPFYENNIVLVHNGTIWNQKDLKDGVEVDSHAIAHALNDHDAAKALSMINGAFALVWYDTERRILNFARNQERPLWLVEYDKEWVFASEIGLIYWLKGRAGEKATQAKEVPLNRIVSVDLSKKEHTLEELEYEDFKHKPVYVPVREYQPYHQNREQTATRMFPRPVVSNVDQQKFFEQYQVDQLVYVKFVDSKEDYGHSANVIFFGHPQVSGKTDEQVLIKYVCDAKVAEAFEKEIINKTTFLARIKRVSLYSGQPILWIEDPFGVPDDQLTASGYYINTNELREIFDGTKTCTKCGQSIMKYTINQMLIKQRKNQTWRIVCPECLQKSMAEANNSLNKIDAANSATN